jgi:hypothetical protein
MKLVTQSIIQLLLVIKLRQVHRLHRMVPIDAYEPDRPTVIDLSDNTSG